jgi:protein associated with RNAse G/E
MNRHINDSIDRFYAKEEYDNQDSSISLNNHDKIKEYSGNDTHYYFRNTTPLSEEELLKIAEKFDVDVEFYQNDDWQTMPVEEYIKERGND